MERYVGTVVAESLQEGKLIKDLVTTINSSSLYGEWHLYRVEVTRGEIKTISKNLAEGTWYAHFWSGDDVVVAYPDKIFEFKYSDKDSWQPAIKYGLSLGIPNEQLDFPIE